MHQEQSNQSRTFFTDSAWDSRLQLLAIIYAAAHGVAEYATRGSRSPFGLPLSTLLILLWAVLILAILLYTIPLTDASRTRRILIVAFGATFFAANRSLSFGDRTGCVAALLWAGTLLKLLWNCREPDDDKQRYLRYTTFIALLSATLITAIHVIPTRLVRMLPDMYWTAGSVSVGAFVGIAFGLLVGIALLDAPDLQIPRLPTLSLAQMGKRLALTLVLFVALGTVLAQPALARRWHVSTAQAYGIAAIVCVSKAMLLVGPLLLYLLVRYRSRHKEELEWWGVDGLLLCTIGVAGGLVDGAVVASTRSLVLGDGGWSLTLLISCVEGGLMGLSVQLAAHTVGWSVRLIPSSNNPVGPAGSLTVQNERGVVTENKVSHRSASPQQG